jgi:hypothetical protein
MLVETLARSWPTGTSSAPTGGAPENLGTQADRFTPAEPLRRGGRAAWRAGIVSAAAAVMASPALAHGDPENDNPAPIVSVLPADPLPTAAGRPTVEVPSGAAAHRPVQIPFGDSEIGQRLQGFRSGIDAYADKLEKRLNDNPVGNYHAAGKLGDYQWHFDGMRAQVEPYFSTNLNHFGPGILNEVSFARTSFQTQHREGDWIVAHGIRADVYGRLDLGPGEHMDLKGLQEEAPHGHFFGPRVELFEHWDRGGEHDTKISADFSLGQWLDLSNQAPVAYFRGTERLENDTLVRRWLGEGSHVRADIEEGIQYNERDGVAEPYYQVFAGVGKPIPIHFKGRHTVDVEVGARAYGTREEPFSLGPQVRAHLHW